MNWVDVGEVAAAGAIGAVTRFLVDSAVGRWRPGPFPLGTVLINLSGSFVLGLLTGLVLYHGAPARLTLVAGTGFCGGYTTFSTASFETVRLAGTGRRAQAATHLAVTVAGALIAAGSGMGLARI